VLARSGAGTVAELAFAGLPSILIPLPGTWGDEQTKNAAVLSAVGGAVVIPQPQASPQRLQQELLELLRDPVKREHMADAARTVSRPDAAARLVDELLALV
jgi:UDP-N-acetylglucosamine--N-acetylmuramyl-(pentapeptide) pyrophosphoryl-undecaprenol N-acetylglucosamine transferase